jgi:hypothetical protein
VWLMEWPRSSNKSSSSVTLYCIIWLPFIPITKACSRVQGIRGRVPSTPVILKLTSDLGEESVSYMPAIISPPEFSDDQQPVPTHRYSGLVILHMKVCIFV